MVNARYHARRTHELVQQRLILFALVATLIRIEHVDGARFIMAGVGHPPLEEVRRWRLDSTGTFPRRLRNSKRESRCRYAWERLVHVRNEVQRENVNRRLRAQFRKDRPTRCRML